MVEDIRTNKRYSINISHNQKKHELNNTTNPCFLHVRKNGLKIGRILTLLLIMTFLTAFIPYTINTMVLSNADLVMSFAFFIV